MSALGLAICMAGLLQKLNKMNPKWKILPVSNSLHIRACRVHFGTCVAVFQSAVTSIPTLDHCREVFAEAAERPTDFSELQMAAYLKASQFRRQVDKLTAQAAAEASTAAGEVRICTPLHCASSRICSLQLRP